MKYSYKSDVKILRKDNKFLYINPKESKWLRVSSKINDMLDNVLKGKQLDDIHTYKKNIILNRFIDADIIQTDKERNNEDITKKYDIDSLYFTITRKCNLSCSFCSLSCGPNVDEPLVIDKSKMKAIIDELKNYKIKSIVITGGEPTLRVDLLEIIDYIHKELDCKLILETNGLLISSNFIENIKGKLHHIDISFENIFEENSEWQYKKIIQVVKQLKENNISMLFSYVLTYENWRNIFKFIDLVEEYKPKHIIVRNIAPIGSGKDNNELLFNSKDILEIYEQLFTYIYENEYVSLPIQEFVIPRLIPLYNCSAKENTLFIDSNGYVYSCPSLFYSDFCYGNIVENGLKKVLEKKNKKIETDFYKQCFEIDERSTCKECEIRYFCGGSCFAEIYANKDKILTAPIDCEFRKIRIDYGLWEDYSKLSFLDRLKNIIEKLNEKVLEIK